MTRDAPSIDQLGEAENERVRVGADLWPKKPIDDAQFVPTTVRELFEGNRSSIAAIQLWTAGCGYETEAYIARLRDRIIVRHGHDEYVVKGGNFAHRRNPR